MSAPSKVPKSGPSAAGAVLLLPGMTLNASIFPPLPVPGIAVDFNEAPPGGGGPGEEGAGAMAAYVRELDRRLDRSAWNEATSRVVVGHSFGGMLALAWWLHHRGRGPARVNGMVLVATTAGPMYDAVRLRLPSPGGRGNRRIRITPLMRVWNTRAITRTLHRLVARDHCGPIDFQQLRDRSDFAVGLAGWRSTAWTAVRGYRLAMWGFDVRHRLHEITVPALVLFGTDDYLFPLGLGEELAHGIPGGELRVVHGAGHVLPLHRPDTVLHAVADLL